MRTQDIVIGETYRHKDSPHIGYAKAVKMIKPIAKFKQKLHGYSDDEMTLKVVCVKCEWTQTKSESFGYIKYFRPCDLIKEPK